MFEFPERNSPRGDGEITAVARRSGKIETKHLESGPSKVELVEKRCVLKNTDEPLGHGQVARFRVGRSFSSVQVNNTRSEKNIRSETIKKRREKEQQRFSSYKHTHVGTLTGRKLFFPSVRSACYGMHYERHQ